MLPVKQILTNPFFVTVWLLFVSAVFIFYFTYILLKRENYRFVQRMKVAENFNDIVELYYNLMKKRLCHFYERSDYSTETIILSHGTEMSIPETLRMRQFLKKESFDRLDYEYFSKKMKELIQINFDGHDKKCIDDVGCYKILKHKNILQRAVSKMFQNLFICKVDRVLDFLFSERNVCKIHKVFIVYVLTGRRLRLHSLGIDFIDEIVVRNQVLEVEFNKFEMLFMCSYIFGKIFRRRK